RKLGRPGGAALLYYFSTTLMAVLVGLVVVNIIQPGNGTVDQQPLNHRAGPC
ncbi:MAG: dicarboxylate/amino acid:cation symporter, partial [Candidatus Electrothrix sp. EH2]|nr:dicarboxylate/amino acid:cation symporter [Candidatus Electrothrix sp. EH2]